MSDKVGGVPLYSPDGALSEMMEMCKGGKNRRKETAALSKWVMCLFALAMFHWSMAWGGNLVVCPDCGNDVSRRAMFCPKCGCAGDVIRKESAVITETAVTGSVLKVDFGNRFGAALPVTMDGRSYAILPLDDALGMDRLILFDGTRQVRWTVPEVAISAPVMRLRIDETNLVYWTVGGTFSYDAARKTRVMGNRVVAISSELPSGKADYRLDACEWQVLQPREMNGHGKLLLRLRGGEPCELPFRTHPYYKYLENQWRKEVKE